MSVSEGCSPKSLLTFSQEEEHVFDSSQIDFGNAIFPRIRLLLSDSKLQSVVSASACSSDQQHQKIWSVLYLHIIENKILTDMQNRLVQIATSGLMFL